MLPIATGFKLNSGRGFSTENTQQLMTWPEFFKKRTFLRRVDFVSGIFSGFSALQGGVYYFLFVKTYDPTALIFGLDPGKFNDIRGYELILS